MNKAVVNKNLQKLIIVLKFSFFLNSYVNIFHLNGESYRTKTRGSAPPSNRRDINELPSTKQLDAYNW